MVCFQTKKPNFCQFWRDLQWKMYSFMEIWYTLWPFGII
jgi:hypothetical protein